MAALAWPSAAHADGPPPYGNYNLQSGDSDASAQYGRIVRSAAGGDVLLLSPGDGFVRQLQSGLKALGFTLVGEADGKFGRHTAWAVREFQIYTKMPKVAQEAPDGAAADYLSRLSAIVNPRPYDGPISGVVNADTRAALQLWTQNRLRCPVVANGWSISGGGPGAIMAANLWLSDDLTDTKLRVYVHDFSGYYTFPTAHGDTAPVVLGDYQHLGNYGGPHSQPPHHTWAEAEVLPEALVGVGGDRLSWTEPFG